MSSRASTAERVEFVRRMQQLYPDFDVTDPCNYIMAKAATWVGCLEFMELMEGHRDFGSSEDSCLQTKKLLCKQRIERRAAEDFPGHLVDFNPRVPPYTAVFPYLIELRGTGDTRCCIPVPTSKRRRRDE